VVDAVHNVVYMIAFLIAGLLLVLAWNAIVARL
jgi:hypothetical protein